VKWTVILGYSLLKNIWACPPKADRAMRYNLFLPQRQAKKGFPLLSLTQNAVVATLEIEQVKQGLNRF